MGMKDIFLTVFVLNTFSDNSNAQSILYPRDAMHATGRPVTVSVTRQQMTVFFYYMTIFKMC